MLAAIVVGITVGFLVPVIVGTAHWLRRQFVATLDSAKTLAADNHTMVMAKFAEIEAEAESAHRRDNVRFTKIELDLAEAIKQTSFLQGVQSERAATAQAAVLAAKLLTHTSEETV